MLRVLLCECVCVYVCCSVSVCVYHGDYVWGEECTCMCARGGVHMCVSVGECVGVCGCTCTSTTSEYLLPCGVVH